MAKRFVKSKISTSPAAARKASGSKPRDSRRNEAGQAAGKRQSADQAKGKGQDAGRNAKTSNRKTPSRKSDAGHNSNDTRKTGLKGKSAPARQSGRDQHSGKNPSQDKGHRRPDRRPAISSGPTTIMRIAKAIARAGLCSRRDAERWIEEGRVKVNGKLIDSPALNVGPKDRIDVDDNPLPQAEPVRLWRYYKPKGLVTSHRDPEGRSTVFASLPPELPRVVSVGRLDFSTEGLLLLTNDGALARHLELPSTGWLRRYRVRAHGRVSQVQLDALKDGITVEGVRYGPIEAVLDSVQGSNVWLSIGIREGKNREVRRVLTTLDLEVNRLIRVSYGPFQLKEMKDGAVELVPRRVLIDQLGPTLAATLGITSTDVDAGATPAKTPAGNKRAASAKSDGAKKPRRLDKKDRPKRLELVDGPGTGKDKRGTGHKGPGNRSARTNVRSSGKPALKGRAMKAAGKGLRKGRGGARPVKFDK